MTDDTPLFGGFDPDPAPADDLSPGRRLTLRQHAQVAAGIHPLTRGPLHPEARPELATGRSEPFTCGSCVHRQINAWGYPKCDRYGPTYQTHGATTDVRAMWPACPTYEAKP